MCRCMSLILFATLATLIWAKEKECSNPQAAEASAKGNALLQVGSTSKDSVKKFFSHMLGDKLGDEASDVQAEHCSPLDIAESTNVLDTGLAVATQEERKSSFNACFQKGIENGCQLIVATFAGHCGCYDKNPCNNLKMLFAPGDNNAKSGALWTQPCPGDVTSVVVDAIARGGRWFYFDPRKMACLLGTMALDETAGFNSTTITQMRNGNKEWSGKIYITKHSLGMGPLYGEMTQDGKAVLDYFNGNYQNELSDSGEFGAIKFGSAPYKGAGKGKRADGDADEQWQVGDEIVLKDDSDGGEGNGVDGGNNQDSDGGDEDDGDGDDSQDSSGANGTNGDGGNGGKAGKRQGKGGKGNRS